MWHAGSSSLTRGRTQAPCIGSMTIRPPGKSLRFCFLKTEEDVIHMKPPAQSDSTGGHIPNLLLLLFKITQSTLYVKRLPIIFINQRVFTCHPGAELKPGQTHSNSGHRLLKTPGPSFTGYKLTLLLPFPHSVNHQSLQLLFFLTLYYSIFF